MDKRRPSETVWAWDERAASRAKTAGPLAGMFFCLCRGATLASASPRAGERDEDEQERIRSDAGERCRRDERARRRRCKPALADTRIPAGAGPRR